MPLYDAFISYSHAKDKPIAAALQSVVQKLGKPWYRRRALRVFRDDTSLSATPHLWPSIQSALSQSGHLVLLASPEAARSRWIAKEVEYWLEHKSADTMFIGLTEGDLAWDAKKGDFKWSAKTPLPKALKGRFASEPKWVDLRAYREGADPRNAHFIELGADFAAAIRGMPKEDLLSQEVRQQRRALRLAVGTAACLLLLAAAATWQWRVAESERALKVEQLRQAQINESGQLGAQAREAAARGNVELAKILLSRALPKDLAAPDRPLATNAAAAMVPVLAADTLDAILVGHTGPVTSMTFSPDGTRILTVSDDKTARVWDASTGLCLLILEDGQIMIHSVAFSADGTRVVALARDGTKFAWSASSGAPLQSVPDDDESPSVSAQHGRAEKKLVVAPEGQAARIVDAATGAELAVLQSDGDTINAWELSPDATRVASSSNDDSITLWDAVTGKPLRVIKGGSYEFKPVFSPDGKKILVTSASIEGRSPTFLLVEAATGETLQVTGSNRADQLTARPTLSPVGNRFAAGFWNGAVYLWRTSANTPDQVLSGHERSVESVTFSPDGNRILTESQDSTGRLWDASTGAELRKWELFGSGASFSPDGSRILSEARASSIQDASTGADLVKLPEPSGRDSALFSPDGRSILSIPSNNSASIWDASTGGLLHELKGHTDTIDTATFSPDGKRVLTTSWDHTARLWDAETGGQLHILTGHEGYVTTGAFSPSGLLAVTGSHDSTARLWDTATGKPLHILRHSGSVEAVAFSPDSALVATASGSNAYIWDAASGNQLRSLRGHGYGLDGVTFSPDGRTILTFAADGTARVWDTATGVPLKVMTGFADGGSDLRPKLMYGAAFNRDGTRVALASEEKDVRVWSVPRALSSALGFLRASITRSATFRDEEEAGLETPARAKATSCDSAADAFDPRNEGAGAPQSRVFEDAIPFCEAEIARSPDDAKPLYQLARTQEYAYMRQWGWVESASAFSRNYRAAAEMDYPMALYAVAKLEDTPPAEAMALLQRAHSANVILAARKIAEHYAQGEGVSKDPAQALQWLRLGAQQGDPWAHVELGRVYWQGEETYGAAQDWQRAFYHFCVGVELFEDRGYQDSSEIEPAMLHRANLARRLPMETVAEIWRLAAAWKPKDPLPDFGKTELPAKQQAAPIGVAVH